MKPSFPPLLWHAVALGMVAGVLARMLLLSSDYRRYPSLPHGYLTHLSLGVIAAAVGAAAIPAFVRGEWTAVTFLVVVATQFREIRDMERQTLRAIDETALVPRGPAYIEGIARVFEARSYLTMFVALVTSGSTVLTGSALAGGLLGGLALLQAVKLKTGRTLGEIAVVREAPLRFQGPHLYVEDVYIMNVGLARERDLLRQHARGFLIEPRDARARDALAEPGQRHAILFELVNALGMRKDTAEAVWTPMLRKNADTGRLALVAAVVDDDPGTMVRVLKRVPVLESARRGVASPAGPERGAGKDGAGAPWPK